MNTDARIPYSTDLLKTSTGQSKDVQCPQKFYRRSMDIMCCQDYIAVLDQSTELYFTSWWKVCLEYAK